MINLIKWVIFYLIYTTKSLFNHQNKLSKTIIDCPTNLSEGREVKVCKTIQDCPAKGKKQLPRQSLYIVWPKLQLAAKTILGLCLAEMKWRPARQLVLIVLPKSLCGQDNVLLSFCRVEKDLVGNLLRLSYLSLVVLPPCFLSCH